MSGTMFALSLAVLTSQVPKTEPVEQGGGIAEVEAVDTPMKEDRNFFRGHLLDGTGYVLPKGRWQIGLIETKYGIFDWLDIGTSPYPWILAPILKGFSGNVSVKGGVEMGAFRASLEARYLYLNVSQTEEEGTQVTEDRVSAQVVPLTAALTFAPDGGRQAYSFATRYVIADAWADQSRQSQEVVEGAAALNAVHLILSANWRISEVFGLYARGYLEPWAGNIEVDGEGQAAANTRVAVQASLDPDEDVDPKWSALGGVHLAFDNVNVRVGLGYGSYFTPAVGLVIPEQRIFPDFDIYVRL